MGGEQLLVSAVRFLASLLEAFIVEVHDQRHRLAAHGKAADRATGRPDRQMQCVHAGVEKAGNPRGQSQEELNLTLPFSQIQELGSYRIAVGLRPSQDELEYNRRQGQR